MSLTYKPLRFFSIAFLITWITWFLAAWESEKGSSEVVVGSWLGLGLLGPLIAALMMIYAFGNSPLRRDFANKLINPKLIKLAYVPFILFFMPVVIVISILLSLPLGQSIEQLGLTAEFSITDSGSIMNWVIPFLAPALEELGWSGYGIDSLRRRFKLLPATLFFGALWAVWHLPLFFVKDYYHYNLLQDNIVYAVNFFVSVIPLTVITNWLYYRTNRSMIAAILFHAIVVVCSEAFLITDFTKCVETVVLSIIAVVLIMKSDLFRKAQNDTPQLGSSAQQIHG
ncbi:CPBP family intramembrane glutamic endopeptidase [Paenibacillus sp. NEAU-GSW1]|uniref:CPBP family intramembrane glutamic endopeptidase n=1 Tax=Paenibacillus sp. NEAU-GSW1 TaxID=2682486 RepID=UPI0012E18F9C|nr:CPBP family intramembrane glutamic endopeptidase [Paenibacillus sp. NEAU-GSW1]MUT68305.1 CPBP family intramembrane metalloprotease [Paenibacillus sp. NEAU-GSW1]